MPLPVEQPVHRKERRAEHRVPPTNRADARTERAPRDAAEQATDNGGAPLPHSDTRCSAPRGLLALRDRDEQPPQTRGHERFALFIRLSPTWRDLASCPAAGAPERPSCDDLGPVGHPCPRNRHMSLWRAYGILDRSLPERPRTAVRQSTLTLHKPEASIR